jgi:hypothetical protein
MHCLNMRSAGISVSAAAYCRQIDSTTAARSSATLGPVCPWTAVPATTHINAATALANQAHFAAAENTGPRLPVCLLPHQIITTQPTRLARAHRAVGIYSPADVTLNTGQFAGPTPPMGSGMCRLRPEAIAAVAWRTWIMNDPRAAGPGGSSRGPRPRRRRPIWGLAPDNNARRSPPLSARRIRCRYALS